MTATGPWIRAVRRAKAARLPRGVRFALDAALGATLMVVLHLFVIQVSVVKGTSMEIGRAHV